ncbi:MAG: stage II sporulation protein P, partial [Clostridia bacterium]|nr:stage II sporulation protein P [Clostridia bacterium]
MNKRKSWLSNSVVVVAMFTFALIFLTAFSFDNYMGVQAENEEKTVFEGCIENVFPVFSRGLELDRSQPTPQREKSSIYQRIFTNMYPTMTGNYVEIASEKTPIPIEYSDFRNNINDIIDESEAEQLPDTNISTDYKVVSSQELPKKQEIDFTKPVVYLYHTHATESYLPKREGNFHSVEESSTVREVGERIAKNLEEMGIKVIHNKTVHDYPSYSKSYARSLKTITAGLEKYKSVKIVIDLHRDASDYKKTPDELLTIDGEKAACFRLVLGTKNDNASELKTFAEYFLYKSDLLYPGLGKG